MRFNIIKNQIPAEQLERLGVGILYLFGSHAEGTAGPSSDIDLGVVFTDPAVVKGDTSEIYGKLFDLFSDIFDLSNFKNIDIVFLERAGLELRFDVISHGIVLFEISSEFRLEFEERTMALYRDFKPLLNFFNQAVLERI